MDKISRTGTWLAFMLEEADFQIFWLVRLIDLIIWNRIFEPPWAWEDGSEREFFFVVW
jgi:hypothetical protein